MNKTWLSVGCVIVLCAMIGIAQQQTINVGTTANDGTGDNLRTAMQKTNANFTDLYANKQTVDSDLTAIAALSPSNDDFLQRKSGAWANRTVAQVATDLQTPFDSRYAPLSHTHTLSNLTQSGATTGQVAAWNGSAWAPATPSGGAVLNEYLAADHGIAPGNSGSANTAALQTLVNTVTAAGGGVIQFDFGTYSFNYTGASPWASYSSNNRYAVQLKSGVYLRGMGREGGTVLKLANSQMSGGTNGVHLFTAGDGCDGFGFLNLELDGNAAGQSGWSGGYSQGAVGSNGLSTEPNDTGSPNIYNFVCHNVYAHDWFSSALELHELANATCQNIKIDNCGEGLAFVRSTNCFTTGFEYLNTDTVSAGDGFESSGGDNVTLLDASFIGGGGGAAIDMATRNFRISDVIIRDHTISAITIQPESGSAILDNPSGILSNCTIEDSALGIQVVMNDLADDAHVTLSNCRVLRASDRGFLLQKHGSVDYGSGHITLANCEARECGQQGLHALICRMSVLGGNYSNNGNAGIYLQPGSLTARDDVQYHIAGAICNNNTDVGIRCITAAIVPRLQISAYCEGNAAGLLYADKYAQMSIPFPAATDIFIENLRPVQVAGYNGTGAIQVCGERFVRLPASPIGEINSGKNGQIVTFFADTGPVYIYDKTTTEGAAYFGNGPCNINCFDAQNALLQVGETATFQYRASTQEWYQTNHSAGRKTLNLSPVALADNGVILHLNPPNDEATTGWIYSSQGRRSQLGHTIRNLRTGGTVYSMQWSAAGDVVNELTDGTAQFVHGLDTSAAAWKVSSGGALGTNDILSLTSTTATLGNAVNVVVGTATGSKIGTSATQKIGFWNATPIVQPAHADQAAVTLGNTNSEISGLTISASYDKLEIEALRDKCEELADDVRALSALVHAQRQALVDAGLIKGSN